MPLPTPPAERAVPAGADDRIPRLTIGTTLLGLVAACLVPAVCGIAWTVWLDYRGQQTTLLHDAVSRARTMMSMLDGELQSTEAGLRLLAASSEVAATDTGRDVARLRERLADARKLQDVDGYVLVDAAGHVRLDTRPRAANDATTTAFTDVLQPVFATAAPFLGSIASVKPGAQPTPILAVPVLRDERPVAALAAILSSDRILAASRPVLPGQWVAAILDRDGLIVARTREAARFVGQPATPSLRKAIAGKREGTAEALTMEGEAVVTAFSRSARSGWTVAVGAPKTTLDAALYRSIGKLVAGVVAAFAVVLWLAVLVSRVISRAVGSLVEPALALGAGRSIELPATALRETDAVGRAMRQASRMLAAAQHHAYHDPLTNLRNRTLFDEMATRQIAQAYRDGAQLAILAIDLDGFKAVNDLHGHAAGDAVLCEVADRITGLVRGSDVVSRRGGDEFSVLLVDVDGSRTRQVAEKLLAALAQPYRGVQPAVSASIGVARYPHDATGLRELLERADEALYAAKHAGKRRVVGDF